MIIYNKKKFQSGGTTTQTTSTTPGATSWYQDPNVQAGVNSLAEGINSQSKGKTYTNTAPTGNMNVSDVEKVDPSMENQGETTSALTGAATGALSGAAAGSVVPGLGTAAGAIIGGVVGGLSSWLSTDSANDAAYDEANKQYDAATKQAQSNYQANAQNRYSSQYSAYQRKGGILYVQEGGQLGVGQNRVVTSNNTQPAVEITQPQQQNVNQQAAVPQPTMTYSNNVAGPTGMMKPGFRKQGGSFERKIAVLLSDSPKKA